MLVTITKHSTATTFAAAQVQMSAEEYYVREGDGSVVVCAEITMLPAGGLECEITVSFMPMPGEKTG